MTQTPPTRGYFGIGAEGLSKPMNLGTLMRTAHAFGASFMFLVDPYERLREARRADTSNAPQSLPLFEFPSIARMALPRHCVLVGVELTDEAAPLPSFRHPLNAAYVFGPERGSLSPEMRARCQHLVYIPTRFCVNIGVAAAITLYDRLLSTARFAERPVLSGGNLDAPPVHVHGKVILRKAKPPHA